MKEQVWKIVQSFGQRRLFLAGEFRVKKEYVERIQDVFDHYLKKESKTLMPTHFGDLERALKGEGAPSADDVAEEAV
jgi:predicted metal-dependent phosphoesterase TrpH